jgi:response regulator of citrate/malate metabolism
MMVMAAVVKNPDISTRELSQDVEISRTTVQRILIKNIFHPFHIQLHQELVLRDYNHSIAHCRWLNNKINIQRHFLRK